MWDTPALEWNALLNRARSALLEQEDLLAVLESGQRPGRRRALADWGATRRRFLHAYYRLAELAGERSTPTPVELRPVVARLEVTARHLQARYRKVSDRARPRPAGQARRHRERPEVGPEKL